MILKQVFPSSQLQDDTLMQHLVWNNDTLIAISQEVSNGVASNTIKQKFILANLSGQRLSHLAQMIKDTKSLWLSGCSRMKTSLRL